MRARAVTVPLLLVAIACTRAEKTPPAEAPSARPDPAALLDAAADAPGATTARARDVTAWASDWPKAWTDPRVVAALADDCSFTPVRPPGADDGNGYIPPDLFACSLGYSQSCNPDPCNTPSTACEKSCEGTCGSCGGSCVTSCTTCKSACTDDTCKKACATTCAECKQTCTRTMDRCVTGDCNKLHKECTARLRGVWNASGCQTRCAAYARCTAPCSTGQDPEACQERCETKLSPAGKACSAKCDALRTTDRDAADMCSFKCIETAPCASFLCQMGWGNR